MKAADLIAFEQEIARCFNRGEIRAPVHLYGDEAAEPLTAIFAGIARRDWVFCSWRSHFQCLLHGVPPERLMADILMGRSIALCYPEHRILSSAIVAGHLPIALGVAAAIRREGRAERVHAFMGDMAARSGAARECVDYAATHGLPIHWIVEDNGLSVCTPTESVWGARRPDICGYDGVTYFRYRSQWPHSGAGKRVEF